MCNRYFRYDDRTSCRGSPSMLIYHWAAPSPLTKFQTLNSMTGQTLIRHFILHLRELVDLGFQLDKSKSIVLTVIYVQEQYVHKEQPRVIFYISSLMYVSYPSIVTRSSVFLRVPVIKGIFIDLQKSEIFCVLVIFR